MFAAAASPLQTLTRSWAPKAKQASASSRVCLGSWKEAKKCNVVVAYDPVNMSLLWVLLCMLMARMLVMTYYALLLVMAVHMVLMRVMAVNSFLYFVCFTYKFMFCPHQPKYRTIVPYKSLRIYNCYVNELTPRVAHNLVHSKHCNFSPVADRVSLHTELAASTLELDALTFHGHHLHLDICSGGNYHQGTAESKLCISAVLHRYAHI